MKTILFVTILALVCVLPVWAQSAAEKELIKIENDWNTAAVNHDGKFLEQLYATEYLSTDHTGKTFNKAEDIKASTDPKTVVTSAVLSDLKVHIYGQTAVVTGLNTVKSTTDGKDDSGAYWFTDVYVKRDGRWQCVATQGTTVAKQ